MSHSFRLWVRRASQPLHLQEYRILLDIEDTTNNVNYLIYTDDSKIDNDTIRTYASTYVLSDKGNMTKFKPVEMKEEFDFIEQVLSSLEGN